MKALPFRIAITFLLISIASEAQFQDRLYPIPELTDEMRAEIDLKDGSVEDWSEVLGEPTFTALDFATAPTWSGYDPASFDFRIWLAWHNVGNHLFVAAEMVDDFVHEHSGDRSESRVVGDQHVSIYVDGDGSGGSILIDNAGGLTYRMEQAQWYGAFPGTYNNDNNVSLFPSSSHADWMYQLPFADGGGAVVSSQPHFGVVEFFVTPFDRLIWDDQEKSIISDLFPQKTIGLGLELYDIDGNKNNLESVFFLFGFESEMWGESDPLQSSDLLARGFLAEAGSPVDDTVVNSVPWAHIKASLSE